jgi:hypothetical protein
LPYDAWQQPNLSIVGAKIANMNLDPEQVHAMHGILGAALTDTLYTVLMALDGEASLGEAQVLYRLYDDKGNLLTGELETAAYEAFHAST